MKIINNLHFHPVGQGLFHSGSIHVADKRDPHLLYVYDCGTSSEQKYLTNAITAFAAGFPKSRNLDLLVISHLHHDHISGLKLLLECLAGVEYAILPYFAPAARALTYALSQESALTSGRGGLPDWYREFMEAPRRFLLKCKVHNVIYLFGGDDEQEKEGQETPLPIRPEDVHDLGVQPLGLKPWSTEKPNQRRIENALAEETRLNADKESAPGDFHNSRMVAVSPVWRFIFFNRHVDLIALKEFYKVFADLSSRGTLLSFLRDKTRLGALAGAYRVLAPSGNLNETSLAVFSGLYISGKFRIVSRPYGPYPFWHREWQHNIDKLLGSVLTGDLTLKDPEVWNAMARRFKLTSIPLQTIPLGYQVPHHGSKHNWDEPQAQLRAFHYLASARTGSKKHPHKKVLRSIQRVSRELYCATEKNALRVTFSFTLHDSLSPHPRLEVETSINSLVIPTHPRHSISTAHERVTTSQTTFCRYLLEALVEMGGSGQAKEVLDRVGQRMQGILTPKDFEALASNAKQIRWRNTAQWARNQMVNKDARMKKDAPHGLWVISDHGREWLKSGGE